MLARLSERVTPNETPGEGSTSPGKKGKPGRKGVYKENVLERGHRRDLGSSTQEKKRRSRAKAGGAQQS